MQTPEEVKQKLRQNVAVVLGILVAVGVGAAAFWPRGEEIKQAKGPRYREVGEAPSTRSRAPRSPSFPEAPRTTDLPTENPTADTEQTALDEPAPRITLEVKQDEKRAFQADQDRRSAALEEELKAKLTPEQQRLREQGKKLWQERLRNSP
ncbi:MAG: hypothetical protein SFV15_09660 [Polyangiaceae bacterium]|nr:hypothetical protein [Polyangiaceae bacterium]